MLALFRRFLNTWVARVFFVVLVVMFGFWGVNDMVRQIGSSANIATVGSQAITPAQFSAAYTRALRQAESQAGNSTLSADAKKTVAYQTVIQMIYAAALDAEAKREGLAVSDDAVRSQVWAVKAFQGTNGQFDHATMLQVLAANNLTEANFIADERKDLLEAQLLDSVEVGAGASVELTKRIFGYEAQTRTADVVVIKRADQATPADPTDLQLHRYYDNHLAQYATPEYRKIRVVVLSADTLARSETVTDAEAKAVYQSNISTYVLPEKRSVRVVVVADQAKAQQLATLWAKTPDWNAMQKAVAAAGGSAVELDDTAKLDFPTPELADAVFNAKLNDQVGPVQAGLGWDVAQVIAVTPPSTTTYDQAAPAIKAALAKQKAAAAIYDQANKLEDAIGQSSDLSQVPSDVGASGAEGTLDANGLSPDGSQAPLPATGDARAAILADAFSETLGQPAEFKEVQAKTAGTPSTFYALTVEAITPSAHKSYDQAATQVRADLIESLRRHEAETAAAQILVALNNGANIATAAETLPVIHSSALFRDSSPTDVPPQIVDPVFAASKIGEATMVETNDGFAVAQLTKIVTPTRSADPIDFDKFRTQLASSMRSDIENTYTDALRNAAKTSVNDKLLLSEIQ